MLLSLYRALTTIGAPAVRLHLRRRRARGREDDARFGERFGIPGAARPAGPLVWIHAASVGESLSVLGIVETLRNDRGCAVLVTTGTISSARLMAERLPSGALHQFAPVDLPQPVDRFLRHWRPDLALWVESEIWPNMLSALRARDIPCVLVNGRMSERSYRRWSLGPRTARCLLSAFDLCLTQSDADAARFTALGALKVRSPGNLKRDALPLPAAQDELERLRAQLAGRPVWLAASTHDPEEAMAGRIHRRLQSAHPGLLTMIVPRHPERGRTIAAALRDVGLSVAERSFGDPLEAATDVYLGDTLGELGLFYRLAPIVFVGRSLLAEGGQNPIEPARLGCALVFGRNMANFADIAAELTATGGALTVADEAGLAEAVDRLLTDPDLRTRIAAAAAEAQRPKVLAAVMDELEPFLQALDTAGDARA